ncbi:MAG TPA: hypothetical protein VMV46_14955 [Thermoanaerobaculia bacterium]|nr:hypothetical protein [Thermoanaerobaculia bacterium]
MSPLVLPVVVFVLALGLGAPPAAAPASLDAPTWSAHVAPILHQSCAGCHRPGQVAPMSLLTYQEARPWAKSIARRVEERTMPPWHATGGTAEFVNDRSIGDDEVETLVRWARAGAPAGDLDAAPAPPRFPSAEWRLGAPDFVITLEQVDVPAGGPDQFHNLVGKVGLPEDRWVTAIEILPGNPKVVHHVIAVGVKGFDVDPQQGWLGAWAAGTEPMVFPAGTGRLLPKGSNVIADMHYHPAETPESDVTRIGLHFADQPPAKELTNLWVDNESFEIPAGAEDHEVRATRRLWQSGKIMTLTPHMHYRGRDFRFVLHYPDGRQEVPLEVARWDFNWQTFYTLKEPIVVPAGTVIEAIAHYDNSTGNPANPDPTKNVRFGNESYDEMMIGFVDFVVDDGVRPLTPFELRTRELEEIARRHPGRVWAVSGKPPDKRSEPHSWAPLYLPEEGDGLFYLITNDRLVAAAVTGIEWQGNEFRSTVELPDGETFGLTGALLEGGRIETTLHLPADRTMPWDGQLAGSS